MADRSQNIFINYKFPMSEAEKANAILTRINQLNNQLQQNAQKTGQVVNQSFAKGKQAIDAANKAISETPKVTKAAASGVQGLAAQFGDLLSTAKAFLAAGVVKEVVDITLAMAELKGNAEGVERGFRNAFINSTQVLEELRAATHGAVSDVELMQRTLQAVNLGVDIKALPQLFEFAAVRAQQTGVSVDYLVDSIVTGIGRKSLLILDNLGISASRLKEELGGASLEAQSTARATEIVGKIAAEELAKMGGFAETSATKVKEMRVAFEELRLELAKKVESGGVIDFVTEFFQDVGKFIKGHNKLVIEESKKAGVADAKIVLDRLKVFKGTEEQKTEILQQEVNSRVQIEGRYRDKVSEIEAKIAALGEEERVSGNSPRIKRLQTELQAARSAVILTIESRKTLLAELQRISKEEEVISTGIIERKKAEIKALEDLIEKTNDMGDLGAGGELTKKLEIAQAELGDLQRAFREFHIKEFKFEIDKATEALNKFIKAGEKIGAEQMKQRFQTAMENLAANPLEVMTPDQFAGATGWDIFLEDMKNAWEEFRTEVAVTGVDILADQLMAAEQLELDSLKNRLRATRDFYDQQQILAGDNQRAKEQLALKEQRETAKIQRMIFEKEKQTRRNQALIDGAAGVVKAFATYAYPAALIISGLIAAQTLSQIRIINRQRSGYKEGVINLQGPGTGTSDSIPANLSKGESVMTAWETQHAGEVLKEIRAKRLDNKVLKELKQGRAPVQQAFNDERIIKAIEKNRPPDVVEQAGVLYDVRSKGDSYKLKIRSKSGRFRI